MTWMIIVQYEQLLLIANREYLYEDIITKADRCSLESIQKGSRHKPNEFSSSWRLTFRVYLLCPIMGLSSRNNIQTRCQRQTSHDCLLFPDEDSTELTFWNWQFLEKHHNLKSELCTDSIILPAQEDLSQCSPISITFFLEAELQGTSVSASQVVARMKGRISVVIQVIIISADTAWTRWRVQRQIFFYSAVLVVIRFSMLSCW